MSESGVSSDAGVCVKSLNASDILTKEMSLSDGDSLYLLNRAAENFAILQCAQKYLDLCENFDKQAETRISSRVSYQRLPKDLQKIEDGIDVLCVAYDQAKKSADIITRNNIRTSILSLSSVYETKVAEAYFSACSVVFDAYEIADKPSILKQLVECRNELQKLHSGWPIESSTSNISFFNEQVDLYGKQLAIDGQIATKKVLSSSAILPPDLTVHTRCA